MQNALRAIMDELGLVYGAFDLSVSNDGGAEVFWFLEINPDGQYGFLEGATGIPITDSLVRFLAKGAVA
ncbi:MAG: hypothetical protein ACRDTG_29915 [Pseudonocardiaceae bacterium]